MSLEYGDVYAGGLEGGPGLREAVYHDAFAGRGRKYVAAERIALLEFIARQVDKSVAHVLHQTEQPYREQVPRDRGDPRVHQAHQGHEVQAGSIAVIHRKVERQHTDTQRFQQRFDLVDAALVGAESASCREGLVVQPQTVPRLRPSPSTCL